MGTLDPRRGAFLSDLAFAAIQHSGVASTLTTIYLLHDMVGPDRAILVGLLVGLLFGGVAATARRVIKNGLPPDQLPPPPPPCQDRDSTNPLSRP